MGQSPGAGRMSYSRFLDQLKDNRVKTVDLYENNTVAIVELNAPEIGPGLQRVRVQLPGTSSELLKLMRDKRVDVAGHSRNDEQSGPANVFLNLLGSLTFPLLLVGGLFFVVAALSVWYAWRRQQSDGIREI